MGNKRTTQILNSPYREDLVIEGCFWPNGTGQPVTGSTTAPFASGTVYGPLTGAQVPCNSSGMQGGLWTVQRMGNGYGQANGTGSFQISFPDKYNVCRAAWADLIMPAASGVLYAVPINFVDVQGANGAPQIQMQIVNNSGSLHGQPVDLTQNQAMVSWGVVVSNCSDPAS